MTLSEELTTMLEKARRYLESAEILRREGDFDSAISRLYYGMFYCAEAMLLAEGHSFSSHRAVISAFAQRFVKPNVLPRELHQWLREGFEKRQISEYEFLALAGSDEVIDLKTKAEKFVVMTEEFLKGSGHL